MTAPNAIQVQGLAKELRTGFLGRKATLLSDVSFRVPVGVVQGFVGPNGAGKSTTIKHLIGAARPSRGTVLVLGEKPASRKVRARLGFMPELPTLPGTLRARELVHLHASLSHTKVGRTREAEVLEKVGLLERANDLVQSFSKGMQVRLALALALVADPELLILDEPMSGLDPLGRQLVRDLIRHEAERGKTVLFSSHVLSDVEQLCTRVTVIHKGRVLYDGDTSGAIGDEDLGVEVEVSGRHEAAALLGIEGIVAVKARGHQTVIQGRGVDAVELANALRKKGFAIDALHKVRGTLEERVLGLLQERP